VSFFKETIFVSLVLFTDWALLGREGIFSINNQYDWPEENPHGVIYSTHQQQFSINMWAGIGDFVTWAYRQPLLRFPLA
jgi:hypothetical protein